MKALKVAALALVASAMTVAAAEIAPDDVQHDDYGGVSTSLTGTPGDPEAGRNVMASRALGNCVACHAVSDMSDVQFHGEVGPSLDGAGERWDEAQLRGIVINAKMVFPESIMPSFYKTGPYIRPGDAFTGKAPDGPLPPLLTAQQVEDAVAYLMTLQ